jgi:D-xylose 1-dehydrogenase (NADP+, D-xylono-1,5-lactone-forming)
MALRWGTLSTAKFADRLIEAGGGRFVAVASRSLERARGWADERGIPTAYGSYEELLADPEIDAVHIPLPNGLHVEWSIRALEAGKHVLCEKPLSRHPAEVERAFDAAQRADRVLVEGLMWRHAPQTARALELIAEGAVGELRIVRAAFSFPEVDDGNVRLSTALDGGALMDVGTYCVSAARTFAGAEPVRAYGEGRLGGDGVDIGFAGTLRFPGDVLAVIDCGMERAMRTQVEIAGSDGTLTLDDPWFGARAVIERRDRDGELVETIDAAHVDPYTREIEDLEAAAAGERAPLLGRDDALGQARTLAALHRAADTGAPVDL